MSVNRYAPHVVVIPEDDANRQIANGFLLSYAVDARRIHVEPEAGGWRDVLDQFERDLIPTMQKLDQRHVILLMDFDEDANRLGEASKLIPENLRDRVFVLGTFSEPERLRTKLSLPFENIGKRLAEECNATDGIWNDQLLRHNAGELDRLRESVCKFIFPS